jgi:hypothetical protein
MRAPFAFAHALGIALATNSKLVLAQIADSDECDYGLEETIRSPHPQWTEWRAIVSHRRAYKKTASSHMQAATTTSKVNCSVLMSRSMAGTSDRFQTWKTHKTWPRRQSNPALIRGA